MMFGALGEFALGEIPFLADAPPVMVVVANPGSAYRYLKDAGKLEHWRRPAPTKEERLAAERLVNLEKARMALLQKKVDRVIFEERRMENLVLAQTTKLQNIESIKQANELRADNLEKARMAMEQKRQWGTPPPNTFHSVPLQDLAEKRKAEQETQRLVNLEKARVAAKEKREKETALKEQRLKNLEKGRKKKK